MGLDGANIYLYRKSLCFKWRELLNSYLSQSSKIDINSKQFDVYISSRSNKNDLIESKRSLLKLYYRGWYSIFSSQPNVAECGVVWDCRICVEWNKRQKLMKETKQLRLKTTQSNRYYLTFGHLQEQVPQMIHRLIPTFRIQESFVSNYMFQSYERRRLSNSRLQSFAESWKSNWKHLWKHFSSASKILVPRLTRDF